MKVILHLTALLTVATPMGQALPADDAKFAASRRQHNPLNPVLAILTSLPPTNLLVNGASSALTNLEGLIAPFAGGPTTQADLASQKPCADMTLIFARGTTEPGNMGVISGPQLVQAIKKVMPGTT